MAARKPDAEVGPLGVWAYDTREELGLSAAQVAARAGVTEPTIRKVEGGSNRTPSKRLVRDMYDYFREIGERDGKPVEPPPGFLGELPAAAAPDQSALVGALNAQTAAISELVGLLRPLIEQGEEDREARLRAVQAEIRSLRQQLASGVSPGRSSPLGSEG